MAEETLTGRAEETRNGLSLARLASLINQHRSIVVTLAIGVATLCIYRLIWYIPGLEGPAP